MPRLRLIICEVKIMNIPQTQTQTQQLLTFLRETPKGSAKLVKKLYEQSGKTHQQNSLSLEQLLESFDPEQINYLYLKYIERPTRRVWRWSLILLGFMLGWVLIGILSDFRV